MTGETFLGLQVLIVPPYRPGRWSTPRIPGVDRRAGVSRRRWKRSHPSRFIPPQGILEPGQVIKTRDTIWIRPDDWARLKVAVR